MAKKRTTNVMENPVLESGYRPAAMPSATAPPPKKVRDDTAESLVCLDADAWGSAQKGSKGSPSTQVCFTLWVQVRDGNFGPEYHGAHGAQARFLKKSSLDLGSVPVSNTRSTPHHVPVSLMIYAQTAPTPPAPLPASGSVRAAADGNRRRQQIGNRSRQLQPTPSLLNKFSRYTPAPLQLVTVSDVTLSRPAHHQTQFPVQAGVAPKMAQVYRERDIRYSRDRSRSASDDERQYKTVSHYKVGGPRGTTTRLERVERYDDEDDRRSRYSHSHLGRSGAEVIEVDRRTKETVYPDRPRSAFDAPSRASDSYRTVEYEREVERDRDYYIPERQARTRVVQESRAEVLSPTRDHYWERRPWDDHETDVRLEKRIVRRDSDGDLKVKEKSLDIDIHKDHHHHHHDDPRDYKERDVKIERRYIEEREPREPEIERYRREVEYYTAPDPPPAPMVLRQKMPEQKVIVNEAPPPAPVITRR
ncbi:hypothetical protein NPX13_g10584 [Xylaria arbuscula]|uniref:Uncharacterized protein n=1 Tax=Xylaria arbuscula TaxID=114810 RepID=A0A9W8N4H8_9PEZI|nr:hypothetical protein NPX13_g10584 [Xylaria arbuscula]